MSEFKIVDKADRKSPLQSHNPTRCDHNRVYITDAYPSSGEHYVCADCGHKSQFKRDLE